MVDGLNAIEGITCNSAQGAMYCFPRIQMPERALEQAKEQSTSVDTLYAVSLLQETGICVVPASGFGQTEGRADFRTTFLPPKAELEVAIGKIAQHHEHFCAKYA